MTIATKNGSVIIKNGSIAQDCGCCDGDIACCVDPSCFFLTHDVRFTISRELPVYLQNNESRKIPETPYVNQWALPYQTYGDFRNSNGVVTSIYRQWALDLPITESCAQPRIEFRVIWAVGSQSPNISFQYTFVYNRHHLHDGNAGICEVRTLTFGDSFAGVCGIPHRDGPSSGTINAGLGWVAFTDLKVGRITAQFVER